MKLTTLETAWAQAALGAMFPGSSETGLDGIGAMDVPGYLNDVMHTRPLRAALALRAAIWLVAAGPVLVLGRLTTIARIAQPERERVLDSLLASPRYGVRMLVLLLKTFGAFLYAGNDAVRARLRPASRRPPATLRSLHVIRPK